MTVSDLDRWITGNYGEDSIGEYDDLDPVSALERIAETLRPHTTRLCQTPGYTVPTPLESAAMKAQEIAEAVARSARENDEEPITGSA